MSGASTVGIEMNAAFGSTSNIDMAINGTRRFQAEVDNLAVTLKTRGAVPLLFGTDNTERLRITSTGNVGIGTSAPVAKLDSRGTVYVATAFNGDNVLAFGGNPNSGGALSGAPSSANGNSFIVGESSSAANNPGFLKFYTTATGSVVERMRLDASGNLGLGVTPSAWRSGTPAFQIGSAGVCAFADSGITAELGNNVFLNSSSQYIYLRTDAASRYRQYQGVHSWLTAGSGTAGTAIGFSTAMTLDASGNLGVGTTTPAYKLDVRGTSTDLFQVKSTGAYTFNRFQSSSRNWALAISSSFDVYDETAAATRMSIDASGNLLVGLASATGVAKLQVSGPIRTTGYTVATLPAGTVGMRTYVTDALAPAFGVAVAGSGAVTIPVFYDGANWIVA
jgi:hypothetical protein